MSRHPHSTRTRLVGLAGTLGLAASMLCVGPGVAAIAATGPVSAPAAVDATVRAAHLSPSMPAADIYVASYSGNEALWLDDATYGEVSPYRLLPPGIYTFSLRKHGAAMSTAPLRTWTLTARAGDAYTAAIVGSGSSSSGVVLSDNLTPPPAGRANVRLIQASSRTGTAQVTAVDGPVIAHDAAFGTTTGYAAIKAGTWPIVATGDDRTTSASVSLRAGSVTSILLLDTPGGGIRLTSIVDAAGAAMTSAPKHAIDAGGGGTATHVIDLPATGNDLPIVLPVLGALLAALLCAMGVRRTSWRDAIARRAGRGA